MKENIGYLIIKKDKEGKDIGKIREWFVQKVSETAYKIVDKVQVREDYILLSSSSIRVDEPFWVLKSEVDTIGKTKYQILEELR